MLKIRRPLGRLIFNMGIAIPGKTVFLIETAPWKRPMDYLELTQLHRCIEWAKSHTWKFPRRTTFHVVELVISNACMDSVLAWHKQQMWCIQKNSGGMHMENGWWSHTVDDDELCPWTNFLIGKSGCFHYDNSITILQIFHRLWNSIWL